MFGDPTELEPLRLVTSAKRWAPDQGRDVLHAGYAAYLAAQGCPRRDYPIADPGDETSAAWQDFSRAALGFVPADARLRCAGRRSSPTATRTRARCSPRTG